MKRVLAAFSGEIQHPLDTADLPTFCMEQTDGKYFKHSLDGRTRLGPGL